MGAPDQGIADVLLKKAYGIAVIRHVVEGAFGIAGRYGKGLVAQRNDDDVNKAVYGTKTVEADLSKARINGLGVRLCNRFLALSRSMLLLKYLR
jgi:lipid-binding SYLF domain-containing protein